MDVKKKFFKVRVVKYRLGTGGDAPSLETAKARLEELSVPGGAVGVSCTAVRWTK